MDGQVTFTGLLARERVFERMLAADLFISASRGEGLPVAVLEAMACGCPVLLSDIPGNQEWITPAQEGWFFPDGDVEGLAQAIQKAYAERQNLPDMGRRARLLAEKRADWSLNFRELYKAYQIALPGRSLFETASLEKDEN